MRRTLRTCLLFSAVLGATALGSGRKLGEFQEAEPMTAEELQAAKARSRSNLSDYGKDKANEVRPFPWKMAALLGVFLVIAIPFGIGAYRRTSAELKGGTKARARPGA